MKYKPTQEQIETQKLGTHIALSANAGSGKTKVLTERYLKIIWENFENNPNIINQIVAITFTEKAASEMLERVIKQVDEEFENTKNSANKKKIRQIKRKLSYAKIMTIHSFCLQILRDYAIDAELQPNFKTLSQVESHLIKREAIYNAFAKFLNENSFNEANNANQKDEKTINTHCVRTLFTQYKPKEIKYFVELLLAKSDIFEKITELYDDEKKYLETVEQHFLNFTKQKIFELVTIIKSGQDIFDVIEWKDNERKKQAFSLQNIVFEKFEKLINNERKNKTQYIEIIESIFELDKIKSKGNKLFLKELLATKGKDRDKISTHFKIFLTEINDNENISLQFNLAKIVLEIAKIAKQEIKIQKEKLNGIDFDDMLQITRNLLVLQPEIVKSISSEYTNIMVDEFQDTNNIQYEIVKSLVPSLNFFNENSPQESPKVFIVGDEKQSIYRFRNADVEVFQQAKSEIKKSNEHFFRNDLQKTKILNNGNLNLTATFRMLPAITAFVNKVCGNIFSEFYDSDYSENNISKIEYSDLVCGRNSKYYSEKICENSLLTSDFGSVKFLLTVKENTFNEEIFNDETQNENNFSEEIPAPQEAELIANYINFIVNGASKDCYIQKEIDGKIEEIKPEYADIAILFRSRTKLNNLVWELIKKNIPYSLASGSGFYSEQIICDLTSYLRFLNNPQDDLALLGVMLSPFFNLNYVDILNIFSENNETEKEKSLWEKVNSFSDFFNDCDNNLGFEKIIFLKNELEKQIEIAQTVSITHLLRMLLNTGNWLNNLIENPAKNHILKNIEKFISIAREFQNRGFSNLNDFVTELEILSEISSDTDATESKNENVVTLQTIHSSKGLEFPIVILYNTASGINPIKLPIISKKYGLVFNSPKQIGEEIFNERIKTLTCNLAKIDEEKLEEAENMRLLYVALTRAKDHLIISANVKKKSKGGFENKSTSFFRMISNSLNLCDEDIEKLIASVEKKINYPIHSEIKLLNDEVVSKDIELNIELVNAVETVATKKQNEKNIAERSDNTSVFIVDDSFNFTEKNRFFSFTELNQHKKIQEKNNFARTEFIKSMLGFNKGININLQEMPHQVRYNGDSCAVLDTGSPLVDENVINGDISTVLNSSTKGIIFHNILQKINDWYDASNDFFDELFLTNLITKELNLLKQEQKIDKKIFVDKCKEIVKTDLLQEYGESLKTAKFEQKLYIPLGENFYTGIIDCLICDRNGNFEIWDWKTNKIENAETVRDLAENYKLQMQMYIYFLMHIEPNQTQYKARLLFTELATVNAKISDWVVDFIWTQADKELLRTEIENNISNTTVWVQA